MLHHLCGQHVEEPPEEASNSKVAKLDPLVGKISGVDAEVGKDECRYNHRCKEANIESVDYVMNIRLVLLQQSVSKGPAYDAKNTINVG